MIMLKLPQNQMLVCLLQLSPLCDWSLASQLKRFGKLVGPTLGALHEQHNPADSPHCQVQRLVHTEILGLCAQ